MGCDIHIGIESLQMRWNPFTKKHEGPQWTFCSDFYSLEGSGPDSYYNPRIYGFDIEARQYGVFAKLANVRNGWGLNPLFPGRGLPDGLDYSIGEDFYADHSYTWATLRELTDADWGLIQYDGEEEPLALAEHGELVRFVMDLRKKIEEEDFQVLYHFLKLWETSNIEPGAALDRVRFIFGFDS